MPKPNERYQRPHTYTLGVGLVPICLAPGRQRTPCMSVLMQADLANTGIVIVGDSQVSVLNGLQLDPGRAIQFSILDVPLSGTMFPTITPTEQIRYARERALGFTGAAETELYLDVADFYAVADAAGQIVRIFWSGVTR